MGGATYMDLEIALSVIALFGTKDNCVKFGEEATFQLV